MLEFGLLGLLEVVDDGRPVELPRGKERALLAVLLLHANEPISTDRIVEEIWGKQRPANAAKTVQVYVSRLRKGIGAEQLQTTPGGYALRVEPETLDVGRFERLAREGRGQLENHEPADAERLLSGALELWRGPALADFRFDTFAQSEARRLEELRNEVVADRVDARLAQGRADGVVAELEQVIEQNPLWERPRAQLMLALYRSGRQADALELYRRTRAQFAEELGLEPGAELQELERAILNHDPALAAPEPAAHRVFRRRRRGGAVLLLVGGFLAVAAAVLAVVELTRGGSSRIVSVPPNSLAAIDPKTHRIVSATAVGSGPVGVAVGEGAVWVADAADRTVSRVDPVTKQVTSTIGTGQTPSAVAAGDGAVWVANPVGDEGTISRIEPQSNQVVGTTVTRRGQPDVFAPPTPTALAIGAGRGWTNGNPRAILQRFSTRSGALARWVFVGRAHSVDGVAVGEGAAWVASSADDTVLRLDRTSGRVTATIRVAAAGERLAGPYGIAAGRGAVWVANSLANTVSRIDPTLRAVTATIRVGRRPTAVAVGEDAVWSLNRGDGTVSRIDTQTNAVTDTVHVGARLTGIAVGSGAVWVTVGGGPARPSVATRPLRAVPLPASSCSSVMHSGQRRPRFLIASDLPRLAFGTPSLSARQMSQAVELVLEQRGFRAGPYTIGYQACDDSSRAVGESDPKRCTANARAFAADASLLALVGAYNSFCTGLELPITNASPSGPLATVSPSNTYVGLTASGPGTTALEPDQYYPTGLRSFVRLAGNDQAQGSADAMLARRLGLHRVYLLDDGSGTAVADTTYTGRALIRLGVNVVGRATWNPDDAEFGALVQKVADASPDGIYVSGPLRAVELIGDLRAALGRDVTFFAPDNVGDAEVFYGRPPTTGLYMSAYGVPLDRLEAAGKRFLAGFEHRYGRPAETIDVVKAAQAAEIVLDAIARSDGTRASVTNELRRTRVTKSWLGSFGFDRNGDPTHSPFTIYRFPLGTPSHQPPYASPADQGGVVNRIIVASPRLADAPRS